MQVLGIDFTSAPGLRKPITCAMCALDQGLLRVERVEALRDWAAFETLLAQPGPWVGGFDFPFGQPTQLVCELGWPPLWADYVALVATLGKDAFEAALTDYKAARPAGQKELARRTDLLARSRSPMKLFNPPVAKMFFQGAPRLLAAGASVVPCRPNNDARIVLEAYPALVARAFIGGASYKGDEPRKNTPECRAARQAIVDGLRREGLARYGVSLELPSALANELVADQTADRLDALLCAVQAAWAHMQPHTTYGIPQDADANEGWIVDPS